VSLTSPSGCQTQGVCKYTKLKVNMQNATALENILMARETMQTKVICNAMINSKRYGCTVLVCEMQ
jgi:hypothetical protein